MKKIILLTVVFVLCGINTFSQIEVDVNLNLKHSVDTCSVFRRDTYINLHAGIGTNSWGSNSQRDLFLNDYDVYFGRSNGEIPWLLSQTTEDPDKEGWPNVSQMQTAGTARRSSYNSNSSLHQHEHRSGGMTVGGQMFANYPEPDKIVNPNSPAAQQWSLEGYEASAEFYANFFKYFYDTGGSYGEPIPKYLEVLNEPFVASGRHGTTNLNITRMHNIVAKRVKELMPDVQVGGYCAAHPAFEDGNFNHWNNNWKLFIDTAGANMDFFSVHLYDYVPPDNPNKKMHRVGSNAGAILDMIEHYSYLALGEVKPFNISEYGYFAPGINGTPYTKERDWGNVRSFSSHMMHFMEKPNIMVKTMPFLQIKGSWWSHESGNRYPYRLLRQQHELEGESGTAWVFTELVKFYQLWSEVKGTRIDTKPMDIDIQADAYVDGKTVYVILNNLKWEDQKIKLNIFGENGNSIESLSAKHAFAIYDMPQLTEETLDPNQTEIILGSEATMILKYTFQNDVLINETSDETTYYADKYYQAITANTEIDFNIDGVTKVANGEAVLRLGLGRDHNKSLKPSLIINNVVIDIPDNFRGYDQKARDRFFGVLEIPIPYGIIEENNDVTVSFKDDAGFVSSMSMLVYNFSKDIERSNEITAIDIYPDSVGIGIGQERQLTPIITPLNSTSNSLLWSTSDESIVSVDSISGLITGVAVGNANITVTAIDGGVQGTCKVTVQTDRVEVEIDTIFVTPDTVTMVIGAAEQLVATILPLDADSLTIHWESVSEATATIDENGLVSPLAEGETVITASADDGTKVANCILKVISQLPASIELDNPTKYTTTEYFVGDSIVVNCDYFAGTGLDVNGRGIKYTLQEISSDLTTVAKKYIVYDESAAGLNEGSSSAIISLANVNASSELTDGHIYQLVVSFIDGSGTEYIIPTGPSPIEIKGLTSAIGEKLTKNFKIYPNPCNDVLNIESFGDENCTLTIFNMLGSIVQVEQINSGYENQIAVNSLPVGSYLLEIKGNNVHKTIPFNKLTR